MIVLIDLVNINIPSGRLFIEHPEPSITIQQGVAVVVRISHDVFVLVETVMQQITKLAQDSPSGGVETPSPGAVQEGPAVKQGLKVTTFVLDFALYL